jgi:hypothetical protein
MSAAQAEADMKTIADQLEQSYPNTNKGWSATVVPSIDQSVGAIRPALLILMAGIAFCPGHGFGQRRQSPARAQHRPREGAATRGGARRRTRAHRAAAADGERHVRDCRRARRHDRDVVDGARLIALAPADLPRMNEVA